MLTFEEVLAHLTKEWDVLKSAPLAGIAIGYFASHWYHGVQLAHKSAEIDTKDRLIARYRVSLGVDKASDGALVELENAEMRAKAATTASRLRLLHMEWETRQRSIEALKAAGKLDAEGAAKQHMAAMRDISQQYERTLRADALNVDAELRRRLGPKAVAAIVGVPQSFFSETDGAAFGEFALMPSGTGMSVLLIAVLADGIDQMSALLPETNS